MEPTAGHENSDRIANGPIRHITGADALHLPALMANPTSPNPCPTGCPGAGNLTSRAGFQSAAFRAPQPKPNVRQGQSDTSTDA
jgi:hypothetical protein